MPSSANQTQQNATQAERLARVTIIDPTNPLYGRCFRACKTTLRDGDDSGSVTIVLPDGQHRVVALQSTSLGKQNKEVLLDSNLPLVSVRTILPVVRLLRDKRILRGEGNNDNRDKNATDGRIQAALSVAESTSAALAEAGNRSQEATGIQLGSTHRTHARSARPGDST